MFKFIVTAHSVVGLVAARYASQQGYNVAVAGAQVGTWQNNGAAAAVRLGGDCVSKCARTAV